MTPRENVLSLYRRKGYEFAPVEMGFCHLLKEKLKQVAGELSVGEYFDYPEGFSVDWVPGPKFKEREPIDWARYFPEGVKDGTTFDVMGIGHELGGDAALQMTYLRHPMAHFDSLEQIQSYPYPEVDTVNVGHLRERADSIHARGYAASGSMACTIWETSWYLRDMTQLMMDMSMEDEKATFLLDKITSMACQRIALFATAGVDLIHLGDDIGMQSTIMMSLDMYRTWLKPRLAKVIATAKKINPDVLVQYHSCGFVEPFINDLIEAGVDILNPVQSECMDFGEIHAKYGQRLSFNGTVGTQTTMPFGTPADVRKVVFKNLGIAGANGGLLCCPTHVLEPEVPWENIEAYVKACKEYKTAGA